MNEVQKPQIIEELTNNLKNALEFGKQNLERHVTAENFCSFIGALAVASTVDHAVKGNYIRAAGWAGFGLFHLQQRAPGAR